MRAAWAAVAALPVLDPPPGVARAIRRRVRREAVREVLGSVEAWQRAALAGVAGFVVSVLLSLLVPYHTMVALCERLAPDSLPAPLAYAVAGALYGLVPVMVGVRLQAPIVALARPLGGLEAAVVLVVVLVPWVLLRWATSRRRSWVASAVASRWAQPSAA